MKGLGGLEEEVMEKLWAAKDQLSVRDLVEQFAERRDLAYTTVLTVVTHLHEKGWVDREKRRRAYFYQPSRSRAEAAARTVRQQLDESTDPAGVLRILGGMLSRHEFDALCAAWSARSDAVDS